MTYADMFSKVKGMLIGADVSDIHEHLAYQFNITGEAEGIFYAEVKDGQLFVEPYEYFDRDAMFTCSAETLFKIAEGKTEEDGSGARVYAGQAESRGEYR